MCKKIAIILLLCIFLFGMSVSAAPSSWALAEVNNAVSIGLVPTHLQNAYQNAISREEFCELAMQVWCKFTEQELPAAISPFADTQNASVAAAYSLGIVKGESETQFSPYNPVTRQEICAMLCRTLLVAYPDTALPKTLPNTFEDGYNIAEWAMESVQIMNLFSVMLGDERGFINPLDNTTREQAILLAYRLYGTQTLSLKAYVEKMMMPINGNSHDNMLNGAFTVGTADGIVYYAGANGIYALDDPVPVTTRPAGKMVAFSNTIYFLGADDSLLYMISLPERTEQRLLSTVSESFSAYNKGIYYKNIDDGGRIYRYELSDGTTAPITSGAAELPIISGKGIFYSDGTGIYRLENDGTSVPIYSGVNKRLCLRDDLLWFVDGENTLCTVDLNGEHLSIKWYNVGMYAFMRDCVVFRDCHDDYAVYKLNYNAIRPIRIDTSTYVGINTYDDYVYGLDANGAIWRFKNNATEKTRIN